MELAIVTGVSRGLGESVAKLFLKSKTPLIGVSRTTNDTLIDYAKELGVTYYPMNEDLQHLVNLEELSSTFEEKINHYQPETIYLVNNAAMVNPVHQASKLQSQELTNHINLNLTAPMIITNALIETATKNNARLVCMTVSSGAADRPIYGWSAYCSSKAGINMYIRTVALEQEHLHSPHKIVAFNPGVMDTEMQQEIRKHSEEEFIDVEQFKDYKNKDMLRTSDEVAEVLYKTITMGDKLTNGSSYSVSD